MRFCLEVSSKYFCGRQAVSYRKPISLSIRFAAFVICKGQGTEIDHEVIQCLGNSSRPLGMTMPVISNEVRNLSLILFRRSARRTRSNTYSLRLDIKLFREVTTCHYVANSRSEKRLYEKTFMGLFADGRIVLPAFAGAENITASLVTPSAAYMDHFVAIEKGSLSRTESTATSAGLISVV